MGLPCAPARSRRRGLAACALGLLLSAGTVGLPGPGAAEPEEPPPGTAIPMVTLDALPLGIPLMWLDDAARVRVEDVLGHSLLAQRITGLRHKSREAVFRFLLDRPDFAAAVARGLRLGRYRVTALDDGYWGDDDRGARGVIRLLYADAGRRLYHLAGEYDRRGLPTLHGQILVLLEFHHEPDGAGGTVAEASLTGYLRVDTPIVGGLAQLVAALARPAVERAVERKVRRFFETVARVSRWALDQPEQVMATLEGHPEVPQDATLEAFRRVLLADRLPGWATEPFRLLPAVEGSALSGDATSP
jgi:hypothetical protein